jgi:hypothetical protein
MPFHKGDKAADQILLNQNYLIEIAALIVRVSSLTQPDYCRTAAL